MKKNIIVLTLLLIGTTLVFAQRKKDIYTVANYGEGYEGTTLQFHFEKGKRHNHPLIAIWLADEKGNYIQTLYVAESIGKGNFRRVDHSTGKWQAGEIQRPAALPFWGHQRGIKNEFGNYLPTPEAPVVDAYTGATPPGSFDYQLTTEKKLEGRYQLFVEINQSWDWNEFWFNAKFPEDKDYKTSCQPAVIYQAWIDTRSSNRQAELKAIGRSHHSGKDGKLYTDLETLSTALNITKKMTVKW
ncbi:MAG: hypothetical protein PHU68_11385 [Paludibacter sp.]|nr:hypothetical protein [Paludibacter sp.]